MLERLHDPTLIPIAIGIAVSVFIHEMGHAFFQWFFRIPISLIEWGKGPRICKLGVLEIRILPFSGGVYPNGAELARNKFSGAVIALGGVLAQWIGVLIIGKGHLHQINWLSTVCITYGICSMISLLVLIPIKGSDGYYIIKAIFKRRSQA